MSRLAIRFALPLLLACAACAAGAAGGRNFYLIASEPYEHMSERFPTLLYRVDGERPTKVRTVTTQLQDTLFVHAYHDKGYVVIGSRGAVEGSLFLDVLNMKSVLTQKSYNIDICKDCSYIRSFLASRNDRLDYVARGYGDRAGAYRGVDLISGTMSSDFDRDDEYYVYSGAYGNGFVDSNTSLPRVFSDGNQAVRRSWGNVYGLGWTLPDDFELEDEFTLQFVNSDYVRVISSAGGYVPRDARRRGYQVFDKAAGAWSKLTLSGWAWSLRAHRHWLVTEERFRGIPDGPEFERLQQQHFPPFLPAGRRFRAREIALTGRLRFYNVRTRELIVHDTGEPNSAVLYVDENDAAYYRVSDELRVAQIENGALARSRVLVKSPVLWAVHWLFPGEE